jgi:hypothetical protein
METGVQPVDGLQIYQKFGLTKMATSMLAGGARRKENP